MSSVRNAFSTAAFTSASDVLILGVQERATTMWLTFLVGVANLSAFTVEGRVHELGGWASIGSAAADYTAPEGPILGASGDLTTAGYGSTVHFLKLDVTGLQTVRIRAAGTASTITGHYSVV